VGDSLLPEQQTRPLRAPGVAIDAVDRATESCSQLLVELQAALPECPLPVTGAQAFSSCVDTKMCFKQELNPISKIR